MSSRADSAISTTRPSDGGRLTSLDMLRAAAALLVLFHHVLQVPAPSSFATPSRLLQPSAFGPFCSAGVDLFFVISGFVIANSVGAPRAMTAGRFLLGRAIRVLPLFWIVSLAFAMQLWMAGAPVTGEALLSTATLIPLPGGGHYSYPLLYVGWSLGFELAFYLVAGTTLLIGRSQRIPALLALLVAAAILGGLLRPAAGPLSIFLNAIFGEFALGVGAWLLWKRGIDNRLAACLAGLGLMLLVSGLFVDLGQGFETDPVKLIANETSLKRSLVWGLPAAMLLLGMAGATLPERWAYRAVVRLGEASYSLYLVHPLVLFAIDESALGKWMDGDLAFAAVLVALSIAAALLLHRLVEKPIMHFGRALSRPRMLHQAGLRQATI